MILSEDYKGPWNTCVFSCILSVSFRHTQVVVFVRGMGGRLKFDKKREKGKIAAL